MQFQDSDKSQILRTRDICFFASLRHKTLTSQNPVPSLKRQRGAQDIDIKEGIPLNAKAKKRDLIWIRDASFFASLVYKTLTSQNRVLSMTRERTRNKTLTSQNPVPSLIWQRGARDTDIKEGIPLNTNAKKKGPDMDKGCQSLCKPCAQDIDKSE